MEFRLLIGGQWTAAASGRTRDLINPATEEVIDRIPEGDGDDARDAIKAAVEAFPEWSRHSVYARGAILERAAEHIAARLDFYARVTTQESGKPLAQSRAEWSGAPLYLRWAAAAACQLYGRIIPARLPGRRIDVTYQPVGVVGVITAWNFPVYNQVRAISSALAAGCTVVSKPSEYTPRSALLLAHALVEAGLPPGVLNLISGEAQPIGYELLNDARVRKIHFTGSTRVGKLLIEGSALTVTRLSLELGGNAPVIVFPDAGDIAAIARSAVASKVRNAGQVCIAPQRFYVHEAIAENFVREASQAALEQVVGDGMDSATTVGPLINATQRDRVERIVDETLAAGARVNAGGTRLQARGYFYAPTIVSNVAPGTALHEEEVFGPVMPVTIFDNAESVITLANRSESGLSAYLFTRDLKTAMEVSEQLEYGIVGINDWQPVAPEAPFGGIKQSGMGRESGQEGVLEYLEAKTRYFGALE